MVELAPVRPMSSQRASKQIGQRVSLKVAARRVIRQGRQEAEKQHLQAKLERLQSVRPLYKLLNHRYLTSI